MAADLPCNDGSCMKCHASPPETEVVPCRTCATPWHVPCLSAPPESLATLAEWVCPDCSDVGDGAAAGGGGGGGAASDLVAAIREIEADPALTEQEKARRRQKLLCGAALGEEEEEEEDEMGKAEEVDDVLDMLDHFNCSICIKLPERPVTEAKINVREDERCDDTRLNNHGEADGCPYGDDVPSTGMICEQIV